MVSFNRRAGIGMVALLLISLACQTGQRTVRMNGSSIGMLREADRYFEQGQYHSALLKYSGYVLAPYPDKKNMAYARHRLGLCYFFLGQYPEANDTLTVLLKEFPKYEWTNEVNEILRQCAAKIGEEKKKAEEQWKVLQQKIEQYEQFTAQNPKNAQYHYELGNLYWSAARFTQAVAEYEKAAQLDPNFLQQDTVKNRVKITDSGKFAVRDPLLDLGQSETIRVVNAQLDRVQRSDWLGQKEVLRLGGFVENAGLRDAHNVTIETTIYDFFENVQDTKITAIGTLPAGGRRAFTVIMDQYTGLGIDIKKFTTQVFYDK